MTTPRRSSTSAGCRRRPRRRAPAIAADVAADAGAEPEQPDHADGDERREILGPHEAREAQSGDGRADDAGHVVADHDRGERAEQQALDQAAAWRRRRRARRRRWSRGATKPPGMSSAQLSMSIARTNAASSVAASTNHAGRVAERGASDAGDEERRGAELRDREGGGLPHRHERQQRRRRQDDAYRVARSTS